jgi:arsenite-transporting ATPase
MIREDAGDGRAMLRALNGLASRRVVLFGGKGGVGKTTVSAAAALHYAKSRPVILFATDPASNLADFDLPLRIESLDADALYAKFLGTHLEPFLEIGDRGTYLDREELRRLFELAMPGVDELMAWMHIGELVEDNPDALIVVDTAPTGHTLRMLSASWHFSQLASALDAMQEKHRAMVYQFTRREVRDTIDAFIEDFDARARRRRELLTDPSRAAFVPVTLSEPWVVEQTLRLIGEIEIDVPFVMLNRAVLDVDCERCRIRAERDAEARSKFARVVDAPRSCVPLDSAERLGAWLG